jgi:hypothetical protein
MRSVRLCLKNAETGFKNKRPKKVANLLKMLRDSMKESKKRMVEKETMVATAKKPRARAKRRNLKEKAKERRQQVVMMMVMINKLSR